MKIVTDKAVLSEALGKVEPVLSSGIGLYRQIHVSTKGKWAVFTGTNTTSTVKTSLEVDPMGVIDESDEPSVILMPPEIVRAVSTLPEGGVVLETSKTRLKLASEHGPRFEFGIGDPDAYPRIDFKKKADLTLPGGLISNLIRYLGAVPSAVLLDSHEGKLVLVSTDKFRLSVNDTGADFETDEEIVVSSALFSLAERVLDTREDVEVIIQPNRVTLRQSASAISVLRSADGFPKYRKLLTDFESTGYFTADRDAWLETCTRASVVGGLHIPMKLDFKSGRDEVAVNTFRTDVGVTDEKIKGSWSGGDLSIKLNIRYFRELVQALSGDVEIHFQDDRSMLMVLSPFDPITSFTMMPVA